MRDISDASNYANSSAITDYCSNTDADYHNTNANYTNAAPDYAIAIAD